MKYFLSTVLMFLGLLYAVDISDLKISELYFDDLGIAQKADITTALVMDDIEEQRRQEHIKKYKWGSGIRVVDKFELPKGNYLYIVEIRGQYFIIDPCKEGVNDTSWSTRITPIE